MALNADVATTWFSITSSAIYLSTVAGMIRAYGFRRWRELGYGTGEPVHLEDGIRREVHRGELEIEHLI